MRNTTESILFNTTSITTINFTSFDSRHLRHLHPQIWACPSPNFQGKPGYFSQSGEDKALEKMFLENTRTRQNPGIFVELGALDGITYSNTLFFERMFDWRGVLIEAQPGNARKLLRGNRKNTVKIPFGICSLPQTEIQMLGEDGAVAGDIATMDESFRKAWHKNTKKIQRVACAPIGTYLSAIGITHIDFFSLDVEGAEFTVLLTMNWNIQVHYLLVENNSKMPNITALLKNHGFRIQEFHHCTPGSDCASNTLFVNDNYKKPNFLSVCISNIYPDMASKGLIYWDKFYLVVMCWFYLTINLRK
ncbi:unnamed protein product [Adineta ricciae]|nr:unnamed protein product [Adineta ricciae]